jgi:DNA-directed RNA polymerase specialized sigma24 family protein
LLIVAGPSVEDTSVLVRRTVDGVPGAWPALQALLEPAIAQIVKRHRDLRRKGLDRPDDVAEVRTASLERLARNDFQNLRKFLEQVAEHPRSESFDAWLYGVVDFAVRDHLRKRYGRAPKLPSTDASRPQPSKRELQSQAGRLDDESEDPQRSLLEVVSVTTRLTLVEIFAFIADTFSPAEVTAIQLYYVDGNGFAEIADALALPDAKHAEQLIRRLNARLRHRFVPRP